MLKFIIVLVVIFVFLFVGGSILFDSGRADYEGVSRNPVAVQVEKVYRIVKKPVDQVVQPVIVIVSGPIGGLLNPK